MGRLNLKSNRRPTFIELFYASFAEFSLYKSHRIGFIFTFSSTLIIAVLFIELPALKQYLIYLIGVVTGMWFFPLTSLFLSIIQLHLHNSVGKEADSMYIDSKGFYVDAEDIDAFIEWKSFSEIIETKRFVFLLYKHGGVFQLFKYLMPTDTVSELHSILTSCPVKYKQMN